MTTATQVRRRPGFVRHYLEMVAAMFVGMAVFGAAVRGVLAAASLSYPPQPEVLVVEMALDMAVAMIVWMRYRGHGWASTLEMAGAMVAPAVVLIPLAWLGLIAVDSVLMLEHVVMLPLMYVIMLRRRHEYEGHAHA